MSFGTNLLAFAKLVGFVPSPRPSTFAAIQNAATTTNRNCRRVGMFFECTDESPQGKVSWPGIQPLLHDKEPRFPGAGRRTYWLPIQFSYAAGIKLVLKLTNP